MNSYVTGSMIREFREKKKMTQAGLAEKLGISDKTVSKWETGRGYPDVTMLEPLAEALGLSVLELMRGESVSNGNRACNMLKSRFYVCPICGNVILSAGEALVNCCGITLPALEPEEPDPAHELKPEISEDEYYVTIDHEMSRSHYISFIAGLKDDGCELRKLYPEGPAEARLKIARTARIVFYCNKHGLFLQRLPLTRKCPGAER